MLTGDAEPRRPQPAKKYAWMVTGDSSRGEDTVELISGLGPGMDYHAGIKNLIAKGTHFRMTDRTGKVQFTGYIVRECTGREPLSEYGAERGRTSIEEQIDGKRPRR